MYSDKEDCILNDSEILNKKIVYEKYNAVTDYKKKKFTGKLKNQIDEIREKSFKEVENNIDLNFAKEVDQFQQFEVNFIKKGVDPELDKKTDTLKDSEFALESIREYLSNLIENKEKKATKSSEFVKIHETEKNN